MKLRKAFAASMWIAALTATTGGAQEAASDTASDQQPPLVTSGVAEDRPLLTNLPGRTVLGGYIETHGRWEQVDGVREQLGFELRRWNLFTATRLNDFIQIGAELEFEDLGQEITLEYATVDVIIHPALTLRAGAILAPLGRFNLAHDSPSNEFTDRPLVSTELIGTALTEVGAGVLGRASLGSSRFSYELYAVNGFNDGLIQDSPDGTRIPLGKGNFEDNNSSPALVGRVTWSPAFGYEFGLSGHRGAYNTFVLDGEPVDERNNLSILAVDFEARVAGVELSGEAVDARIELPAGMLHVFSGRQRGVYLQAVRDFGRGWVPVMPGSNFAVAARYDGVDFDAELTGDSVQCGTVGLNFRPSPDAVIKLDYFRERTRDRFNNAGDGAGVLFSIATFF